MIPKTFNLMGATYRVRRVDEKDWTDDEALGFCNFQNHSISVYSRVSDIQQQQTFCHELVHAILAAMNEHELNDDEKFVDVFGNLLHQAWTSIK